MFRRIRAQFIVLLFAGAALAGGVSWWVIDRAIVTSAAEDITAEIAWLSRHRDDFKVVAVIDAIEYRLTHGTPSHMVYMALRADGSPVSGTWPTWPAGVPTQPGWYRFTRAEEDIYAQVMVIDTAFPVLVGRKLNALTPIMANLLPVLSGLLIALIATLLTVSFRETYRLRKRLTGLHETLLAYQDGNLMARAPKEEADDEIAALSASINRMLTENSRLIHGLEAASQSAAHELRGALSRLLTTAREQGQSELAEAITELLELLEEVLALAKIEAGSDPKPELLELSEISAAGAALYRDSFEDKNVELCLGTDPATVFGNRTLLTQVLLNLLDNALAHTPEGGKVSVTTSSTPQATTWTVSDSGEGTASDDINTLIESSRRGDASRHGFGLRFVQAVAIRHGARVRLEKLRPGLAVHFVFPGRHAESN